MRTKAPSTAPFFRSDLQARLLAALFAGPGVETSAAELQERLNASRSGIHQELARLSDAGVLERRVLGRTALYRPARDSPVVEPLRQLVERTVGVEPELRRALARVEGVEAAAIFGSFASGTAIRPTSDVDVLVIGDPDPGDLERAVRSVERLAARDINLVRYAPDEWMERVREGAGFAATVLERRLTPLVGRIPGAADDKG